MPSRIQWWTWKPRTSRDASTPPGGKDGKTGDKKTEKKKPPDPPSGPGYLVVDMMPEPPPRKGDPGWVVVRCPDAGAVKRGDKGWGASCEQTQECQAGLVCLNGSCEEGKDDGSKTADTGTKKNIISVGGQFDFLLIGSADKVCTGTDASYTCFYPDDGGQFYGKPADKNGTNGVQGGFGLADVRLLAGYDRLITQLGPGYIGVGVRLGWAFGGSVGIGTVLFALGLGPCIEGAYWVLMRLGVTRPVPTAPAAVRAAAARAT